MSKQSVIKPESIIPVYTQNNVIAGCTTHGSASLQAHQINECHTQKQHHMNQQLAGGASAGAEAASAGVEVAKTGTVASGAMTIDPPQELSPSVSDTANSKANIKAAGGNLLNVHNNRQQTCGPDGEYCKNLGEATQNQNQSGGTKTKKNKKRKNKKSVRKLKGILKKERKRKTQRRKRKTKTQSRNTKKIKKRKTKKVRFSKN